MAIEKEIIITAEYVGKEVKTGDAITVAAQINMKSRGMSESEVSQTLLGCTLNSFEKVIREHDPECKCGEIEFAQEVVTTLKAIHAKAVASVAN